MRTRARAIWLPVVAATVVLASSDAWGLARYVDYARRPATGAPVHAVVRVLDESGSPAPLFWDAAGTMPRATSGGRIATTPDGYFEFFVASGSYELCVLESDGETEIYCRAGVAIIDPQGPQTVRSDPNDPALRLTLPGADTPIHTRYATNLMRVERRNASGTRVGAPWLLDGYRAEQGITWHYNTYGRGCPRWALEDATVSGHAFAMGMNTADAGTMAFGSLTVDWHGGGIVSVGAGGVQLSEEAGSAVNVELGVAGAVPAAGDVVILASAPHSVTLTSQDEAAFPLAVTGIQTAPDGSARALLAVAGIADVRVTGPVTVGDRLVTSTTPGHAQAALDLTGADGAVPAVAILGSALTSNASGAGVVRARVSAIRPTCADVDGDRAVDSNDVTVAAQISVGLLPYEPEADVVEPYGVVTSSDVNLIQQVAVAAAERPLVCGD